MSASPNPNKVRFVDQLKNYVQARYPILYVPTFEDQRLSNVIHEFAKSGFQSPFQVYVWTMTEGFSLGQQVLPGTVDVLQALDVVQKETKPSFFIFKDLPLMFKDNPKIVRKLRNLYQQLKSSYNTIIISHTRVDIPEELSKEIAILEFDLPDTQELEKLFDQVVRSFKNLKVELNADDVSDFVKSALGLTYDEARAAYIKACTHGSVLNQACVAHVIEEKCKIIRKDGILDFIPINYNMQEIGGLENLKEWLEARKRFFSKDAKNFGVSPPKGLLLTGISGCGKSSCIKAISQYWRLPLMRLDMTKVYGGTLGNPEETMRRALKTVEALAPVILWLEEIEKGVAGFTQGDGGVTARIFSSFLTWMQEKDALVFVAATANEIDKLPPELLRKGRFDEIFFVDLPNEKERIEIFKVHIQKRNHNPEKFNLVNLAKATNGFSGAEIEQIVAAGMFAAFNEKRQFNDQDLYKMIGKTVPLSTTMSEPIKEIKRWADTRAVKASKA